MDLIKRTLTNKSPWDFQHRKEFYDFFFGKQLLQGYKSES